MQHKGFPLTILAQDAKKITGIESNKDLTFQGISYISSLTNISPRTLQWRAQKGLIQGSKRIYLSQKRCVYAWLQSDADAYILSVNSNNNLLFTPANDENYNQGGKN